MNGGSSPGTCFGFRTSEFALSAAAGLLVLLGLVSAHAMGRGPLGEAYRYDARQLQTTDPALVLFDEAPPLRPGLRELRGIAVGSNDTIGVAGDTNIVILSPSGERVGGFPVAGPPRALAVASDGLIYVGLSDHVEVYEPTGAPKASWTSLGENAWISSVAIGSNDVLVADAGARVVMRFDRSGALLGIIGRKDPAKKAPGFVVPSPLFDVAVGTNDMLWATNPGSQRVEHYERDGRFVSGWGAPGVEIDRFCGCCNPGHLAIRRDGSFVTAEKGLPRVKLYDPAGGLVGVVAGGESFDEDTVGLDLAVDSQGRILVLDPKRGLVRVFVEKPKRGKPPP